MKVDEGEVVGMVAAEGPIEVVISLTDRVSHDQT
jgi:hypothetical protein